MSSLFDAERALANLEEARQYMDADRWALAPAPVHALREYVQAFMRDYGGSQELRDLADQARVLWASAWERTNCGGQRGADKKAYAALDQAEMIIRGADPIQIKALAEKAEKIEAEHPEFGKHFRKLEAKLLKIGGLAVVWGPEPDLSFLLSRGRRFKKMPIEIIPGRNSHCHWNVADMWRDPAAYGLKSLSIMTGWVLGGPADVWRQHTWGVSGKKLIETTIPRDIYWGVKIPDRHAEEWTASLDKTS